MDLNENERTLLI